MPQDFDDSDDAQHARDAALAGGLLAAAASEPLTLYADPSPATLPEGAPTGTPVTVAKADEASDGDGALSFTIASGNVDLDGDGVLAFAIDADGAVTVADPDDLDFETRPTFTLRLAAMDSSGQSDAVDVEVILSDLVELIGGYDGSTLIGGPADNLILGLHGDDTLQGSDGDDVLRGGEGIDTVREISHGALTLTDERLVGRGTDLLEGFFRAELVGARPDPVVVYNDVLDASGFTRGTVLLDGYLGDDTLIAPETAGLGTNWTSNVNRLTGDLGDDSFVGGAGRDMIVETGAASFVAGDGTLQGLGEDVFSGIEALRLTTDSGDSLIDVSGFRGDRTYLKGGLGDDAVIGGGAYDVYTSTRALWKDRNDVVATGTTIFDSWTDTLVGIDALRLVGGFGGVLDASAATAGTVEMSGGLGDDTFIGSDRKVDWVRTMPYLGEDWNYTVAATQLITRRLVSDEVAGTDTLVDIDYVRLVGGRGASTFDVSGFEGERTFIQPGGGADTVIGRAGGVDRVVAYSELDMTLTDDQLLGQGPVSLRNVEEAALFALAGDVVFNAAQFTRGPVFLTGGAGDDVLRGGASSDELTGNAGNDTLFGGAGWDMVVQAGDVDMVLTDATLTGVGTDELHSIERAHLTGGLGDNTLDASAFTGAMVILEGGWGDDRLVGRAARPDAVQARGDVDFVLTDDTLTGLGTDALVDIDQARLYGWSGSNTFDASAFTRGEVRIYAGAGDDVLVGGQASDRLFGDVGADVFWLLDPAWEPDEIDFEPGEDALRLSAAGFSELPTGTLSPDRLFVDAAPTGGAAALIYDTATGALSYDADGSGAAAAVRIATLRDAPALEAADIAVETFLI
ncbi:hypothetical protein P2H44_19790 [Albimonas sp. CAU 1670]|uniref:hypothetical protein n=1 Tax=Albimonas sp. CAU 1670 TaxID=3032599 RepID=UPI0023D99ECA|nr:hypothetical protein [Albimonas sp. CAU 1670]MDF2234809.1 hypothetical protein [Albimonas sp. CAU 1670]